VSTALVSDVTRTSTTDDFEQIFTEHSGLIYRTAYGTVDTQAGSRGVVPELTLEMSTASTAGRSNLSLLWTLPSQIK
jgi:hypothetical protein